MESENKYNPSIIEQKWQKLWEDKKTFSFDENSDKEYFYCLEMFPYPSGKIHMGHVRNYTIGDVVSRYYSMKGRNVLHPIGWDAFGMPAENAAIKNKIHPGRWTKENISQMNKQLRAMGISYDWEREFATCDPEYYKWNQWFFIQMYKRGLIEYKVGEVNWCPCCQTVLANEQVGGEGDCWRCSTAVEEKKLKQWFVKITDYAQQLLDGHKFLEKGWPPEVLAMQKNWIGKSFGAEIKFSVKDSSEHITVYTTRPDTLFGAAFMVLAPEHFLAEKFACQAKNKDEITAYIEKSKKTSKKERISAGYEKSGVFLGAYAVNPINNSVIPIYIADYVLAEYGFGAVMAVPAHDQRDYEFAKKYSIPIIEVIKSADGGSDVSRNAFEEEGILVNSGEFNGLSSTAGGAAIVERLSKAGAAKKAVKYRLKDWLISRQRYWGTPIPMVHCCKCGHQPVREEDLPVVLPADVEFKGEGESPLKKVKEFVEAVCPLCGGKACRETDTMDTFVDSSWYYARYLDPKNSIEPFSKVKGKKFLPVNRYIGGIEHACMHLIYSRFFHKFMKDVGFTSCEEPFENLLSQGMVTLGGSAMSKSKGNIVEPTEIINKYGADTVRMFILFAAPPEKSLEWSNEGLEGSWRFLNRVWRVVNSCIENKAKSGPQDEQAKKELTRLAHKTIKNVTKDLEEKLQFNTCIARLMEFSNALQAYPAIGDDASIDAVKKLVLMLYPFAPHICEELWQNLGYNDILYKCEWPCFDASLAEDDEIEIPVQLNGKLKQRLTVPSGISRDALEERVLKLDKIQELLNGKQPKKVIVVPRKMVNIVI